MKIREFRRQIPNTKLKPISKNKAVNMSVDAKRQANNEPLLSEGGKSKGSRKHGPATKPKTLQRRIIRDASAKVVGGSQAASQVSNRSRKNSIQRQQSGQMSERRPPVSKQSQRSVNQPPSQPEMKEPQVHKVEVERTDDGGEVDHMEEEYDVDDFE